MQIKNNYIPLEKVQYCHDGQTVQEAMEYLESVGFRCVPVLSQTNGTYLGNVYVASIYRYLLKKEGEPDSSIQNLLQDQDTYIDEGKPFIDAFFNIREFPYLPVVNKDRKLAGILTHSKVIDVLQHSWGLENGGYTLTVVSTVYHGALKKFVSLVSPQANIEGLLTLDDKDRLLRRLIVTLSDKDVDRKKVDAITRNLEKNGFRVISVQEI